MNEDLVKHFGLNAKLISEQNVTTDEIADMIILYKELEDLIKESKETVPSRVKQIALRVEEIEFELQRLWHFPQDANYHRYWLYVGYCKCPRLDNLDPMFFGGGKIVRGDCPVHGKEV